MNAVSLRRISPDLISVWYAGRSVGTVELYSNDFHRSNQYLRLCLSEYDGQWAGQLFSQLQETVKKPLQVMASSNEVGLAGFLSAGGFACKRKCYEMEVSADSFLGHSERGRLSTADPNQPAYIHCCQLLFHYYRQTHRDINPLTADFETFCAGLPSKAFYEMADDRILHAAFVEENEIAYVASADVQGIPPFCLFCGRGAIF